MTHRQWVILQVGLLHMSAALGNKPGSPPSRVGWDEEDGPLPTEAEINAVAALVGRMPKGGKPGEPKFVRCRACLDRAGYDGLGRTCKPCGGQGEVVDGTW